MTVVRDRLFTVVVNTLIPGADDILRLFLKAALAEDVIVQLCIRRINVTPRKGNAVSVRGMVLLDMVFIPSPKSREIYTQNLASGDA